MKSLMLTLAIGLVAIPVTLQIASAADTGSPAVESADSPANPAADNSKTNVRDRDAATLTPLDQGGSQADRTITGR